MAKETIIFITRSSKYHRDGKQLFHEEKVANFLVGKYKTIVVSTSLKKNQKELVNLNNNGIEYIYLPESDPEIYTKQFQNEIKKFLKTLINKKENIIIFGNDFSLYPFCLSNEFNNIKFIHNVHSTPMASFEISENFLITIFNFIRNFKRFTKRIIKNNSAYKNLLKKKNQNIVFSSSNLKKVFFRYIFNFTKFHKDKSTFVIPLCMDAKYDIDSQTQQKINNIFDGFRNDSKPIIAYIGRMTSKKGIWKILRLALIMQNYDLSFQFLIAGPCDPKYLKKIKNFINIKKLKNINLIPKGLKNEEVRYYYQKCDFAIHISNIFEGLSYSIHEAMLSKCIVISNYSNEIINKENGLYYKSVNYLKILNDISSIYKNKDKLHYLQNNARKQIEKNYSKEIYLNKFISLIKN